MMNNQLEAGCDSCGNDVTIDCHDCEQHQEHNVQVVRGMIWELQTFCNTHDLGNTALEDALNGALGDVWDITFREEK
jgi:hypothetical protein